MSVNGRDLHLKLLSPASGMLQVCNHGSDVLAGYNDILWELRKNGELLEFGSSPLPELQPGASAEIRLTCHRPAALFAGDDCRLRVFVEIENESALFLQEFVLPFFSAIPRSCAENLPLKTENSKEGFFLQLPGTGVKLAAGGMPIRHDKYLECSVSGDCCEYVYSSLDELAAFSRWTDASSDGFAILGCRFETAEVLADGVDLGMAFSFPEERKKVQFYGLEPVRQNRISDTAGKVMGNYEFDAAEAEFFSACGVRKISVPGTPTVEMQLSMPADVEFVLLDGKVHLNVLWAKQNAGVPVLPGNYEFEIQFSLVK